MQRPPGSGRPLILSNRSINDWISRVTQKHREFTTLELSPGQNDRVQQWVEVTFVYSTLRLEGLAVTEADVAAAASSTEGRPVATPEVEIEVVELIRGIRLLRDLALSKGTGGSEELQRSLVGELLVVPHTDVTRTFALFVVIGVVHFVFRKRFFAISADPEAAASSGLNVRWWDFVFYILFGLVVTSFVHIGGVLLVFSYLVVPAVCATYLVNSIVARFAVGWGIATLASVVSLLISSRPQWDLPIGATIVCVLGATLLLTGLVARFRRLA